MSPATIIVVTIRQIYSTPYIHAGYVRSAVIPVCEGTRSIGYHIAPELFSPENNTEFRFCIALDQSKSFRRCSSQPISWLVLGTKNSKKLERKRDRERERRRERVVGNWWEITQQIFGLLLVFTSVLWTCAIHAPRQCWVGYEYYSFQEGFT